MGWLLQGHFCDMRKSCHGPLLRQCLWAVLHHTRLWAAEGCYRHEQHLPRCSWWLEVSHFVLVTTSLPLNTIVQRERNKCQHIKLGNSINTTQNTGKTSDMIEGHDISIKISLTQFLLYQCPVYGNWKKMYVHDNTFNVFYIYIKRQMRQLAKLKKWQHR